MIKKLDDKEFLSNLPEIKDPMRIGDGAGDGTKFYDTGKRWTKEHFKELKNNCNR